MSSDNTQVTEDAFAETEGEANASENASPSVVENEQEQTVSLAEYERLQSQSQEYLDGWQRTRAEFANYKKRVEREMQDSYQSASADVLKGLLPIIDDFDRAIANVPQGLSDEPWVNGVIMIQRKLVKLLDEFGIEPVDPTGQPFDPKLHEAVGMDEASDVPSGHVTATMQKGYVIGDRVLRPALVRVAQ